MIRPTCVVLMLLIAGVAGCSGGEGEGGESNGDAPTGDTDRIESQLVITLHVKGGDVDKLKYLRSQVAGFGTCAEAKMDTDTWTVYALMKPGVPREFGVEERKMLEAYIRPPLELLMSSWSYNEGNWFALIGQ